MSIKYRKTAAVIITALASVALLSACSSDAKTASDNLSKAADNFEVQRRIVFFNGITDKYLMTVEGRWIPFAIVIVGVAVVLAVKASRR
jgi:protein involved in sex pheromone biosynthesis